MPLIQELKSNSVLNNGKIIRKLPVMAGRRLMLLATAMTFCLWLWALPAVGSEQMMAAVQPPAADTSPNNDVDQPSTEYQLSFQGNSYFSAKQLRQAAAEELMDFDRLGHRKAEADDAAFQMSLAYKKAGFAFANVNYLYQFEEKSRQLTFLVDEGPRVVIQQITFSGNVFFTDSALLPFFHDSQFPAAGNGKTYYNETNVLNALQNIRDLYYGEGFADVSIQQEQPQFSSDRKSVSLSFEITEGPRYIIQDIELQGEILEAARQDLQRTMTNLTGEPYFAGRKLQIRSSILELYGNLGYPDVGVAFDEKTGKQPGQVLLRVDIQAGPKVTIRKVTITGNQKTKKKFIRNRLKLHAGDLFSLDKKRQSFHNLYKTGLFTRVAINLEPTEDNDERVLAVEVAEAHSRELSFATGWGSYELLRFSLGFRDRNFRGTGRIVRTEGHLSFKSKSALVGLTDPWFLNTDISADLPFSYRSRQEPSFTQEDITTSLLFSKKMGSSLLVTLGYSFRLTSISDIDPYAALENADTGYNLASIKLQATWDTRNDLFFPTSGFKNFVAAEIADTIILSDVALVRITAGSRYFRSLSHNNILGFRYSAGLIIPGRNQVTLPLAERFFNGGEDTVRSYREAELGPLDLNGDPVGGMAFNVANLELRHRFSPHVAATLFFDAGNISPTRSRSEEGQTAYASASELLDDTLKQFFRDFHFAVGIGLQYLLPVGPIRLDVAMNPSPNDRSNEREYVIHFSMGMAF